MTYTDHGTFVDEYLADGSPNPDFDPNTDPSLNAELFNAINSALVSNESKPSILIEQGGVYPTRTGTGPALFVGVDNPGALLQSGDAWVQSS